MQQNVKETEPMLESTDACNSQTYSFRIQIIHAVITNITTNHIIKSSTENIYILASLLLQSRMSRNDSIVHANNQLLLKRRKRKFTGGSSWSRFLVRHNKLSWVLVIEIFSQPGINFHHSNCLYVLREILVFPLQNEDGCGCWDEPQLGMPKSTGLVCPESWLH